MIWVRHCWHWKECLDRVTPGLQKEAVLNVCEAVNVAVGEVEGHWVTSSFA